MGRGGGRGLVRNALVGLVRWDGLYFVDIARNGYKNLKTHAFFPGFPYLVEWIRRGLQNSIGLV